MRVCMLRNEEDLCVSGRIRLVSVQIEPFQMQEA